MVMMNDLPYELRDYIISSDVYTIDDNGAVYDPYYEEYPDEEQIREQMEYQRSKPLELIN